VKLPLLPRHRDREPIGPLIDIVFLLLIFFMLAGTLTPPESFPVRPPRSASTSPAGNDGLRMLLTAEGRLVFEGREINPKDLAQILSNRLSAGVDTVVQLKADAAVATGELITIMDSLRQAGIPNILLLTIHEP
jgi:biopolymer transport protein ExbD